MYEFVLYVTAYNIYYVYNVIYVYVGPERMINNHKMSLQGNHRTLDGPERRINQNYDT